MANDIIVLGGSAGAVPVLFQLVAGLPSNFAAALLVVTHIGAHPSELPELLSARGPLKASHARNGDEPALGQIQIAPPDRHLMVRDGRLRLNDGAKENWSRPAIDPLFRSAALEFGNRVTGVIISGMLDDGSAGLKAVKLCGGTAIVQDPHDAEWGDMPANAMKNVAVDHCVPISELARLLVELTMSKPSSTKRPLSEALALENAMSISGQPGIDLLRKIAQPSTFSCPDCRGVLWRLDDGSPVRYRCHTGHAYTALVLEQLQDCSTEETLRSALRAAQEQEFFLQSRLRELEIAGESGQAVEARRKLAATTAAVTSLRELLARDG